MNILEVNFADITGRAFNGYDLMKELRKSGRFNMKQIVGLKLSSDKEVVVANELPLVRDIIYNIENRLSIPNTMSCNGEFVYRSKEFQYADIVHFHIMHNGFISLLDYPRLFNAHSSVWTLHDPWAATGCCVHPLRCAQWMNECENCPNDADLRYIMDDEGVRFLWKIKKEIFSKINPHIIVSSEFMADYVRQSPLTKHFEKISIIPFGIKSERFDPSRRKEKKMKLGISPAKIVIGFRGDKSIKGAQYIIEALPHIENLDKVELLTVSASVKDDELPKNAVVHQLGWLDDMNDITDFFEACDIFLMPSLAESFGVMAIEAMAAGCVVICFQNTTVESITHAPNCGIAVEYESALALADAINNLLASPDEIHERGVKGQVLVENDYRFEIYAQRHRELYENIYREKACL